jgi:hypothetical protein
MEALCKKLREDARKLKEENTKLEEIVESHDELITEIAMEIRLDRVGEDAEAEDEDDDDGGDIIAPLVPALPIAASPEEIVVEEDLGEVVPE